MNLNESSILTLTQRPLTPVAPSLKHVKSHLHHKINLIFSILAQAPQLCYKTAMNCVAKLLLLSCASLAFGLLGAGCASSSQNLPKETPLASSSSKGPGSLRADYAATPLGPGDIFEVRVYDEKELTGVHRVAANGRVDIPLIGRLDVNLLSRSQLVDLLRFKLSTYIIDPQVSVFIKERKSKKVYVFGKVKKPGTFTYENRMNIIQAITLAGGFDKLANQTGTYVNRIVEGQEKRIEISVKAIGQGKTKNFPLLAGDIIYVPESIF